MEGTPQYAITIFRHHKDAQVKNSDKSSTTLYLLEDVTIQPQKTVLGRTGVSAKTHASFGGYIVPINKNEQIGRVGSFVQGDNSLRRRDPMDEIRVQLVNPEDEPISIPKGTAVLNIEVFQTAYPCEFINVFDEK